MSFHIIRFAVDYHEFLCTCKRVEGKPHTLPFVKFDLQVPFEIAHDLCGFGIEFY